MARHEIRRRIDLMLPIEGIQEGEPSGPCGVYADDGVSLTGHFKTWEAAH